MTTFNSWIHPKTQEVRIYVKGLPRVDQNSKIWIYETKDGKWDTSKKIACRNIRLAEIEDSIEFALSETLGVDVYELRTMSFNELLGYI